MNRVVRLTVVTGPHRGQKFCLRGPTQCLLGRAPDCFVQLAGTDRDQYISRRHCRLSINEGALTLQDLDSRAGTYLDGERVDSTSIALPACSGCCEAAADDGLPDHDRLLTVGGTTLRLSVVDCPPRNIAAAEAAGLWQSGETAKKDCPVPCEKG